MTRYLLALAALSLLASGPFVRPAHANETHGQFIKKWDPDHDNTLDLQEVDKAADAEFDKLDTDHDGTLDRKELGHRVTDAEFKAANPDKDGTLDKAEYRTIVEQRFKAANPDSDGTLDAKELGTPAGKHLLQLLH